MPADQNPDLGAGLDFYAASEGLAPARPGPGRWAGADTSGVPAPHPRMTRTQATATSFGLFGRCVVTVVVLLVPGLGVALAMVAGGAMLADPFAVTSLVTSLGFAGWIVRLTWRPARSLRAPPR